MKFFLLAFCTFFAFIANFLSAQATEKDCSELREINVKIYEELGTTCIICDSYWTWTCRKCGTVNVQEASRCSSCRSPR